MVRETKSSISVTHLDIYSHSYIIVIVNSKNKISINHLLYSPPLTYQCSTGSRWSLLLGLVMTHRKCQLSRSLAEAGHHCGQWSAEWVFPVCQEGTKTWRSVGTHEYWSGEELGGLVMDILFFFTQSATLKKMGSSMNKKQRPQGRHIG